MTICFTLAQFREAISKLSDVYKIGFVPTMGALHKGHISLVKSALEYTPNVVVSIFVNPTQFNNPNDLARYPSNIEGDCKALEEAGTSIVFIPSKEEIYPKQDNRVFNLGTLDKTGEGPRRPGHFNGVAQVVTRLFDIVKPQLAFFGEKDFQQLAIIKHFTKELSYPIEIIACPTIRESDGLAMSSRNMLLTHEHRSAAPRIFSTLERAALMAAAQDLLTPTQLSQWVKEEIDQDPLLKTEYAEVVNSLTLELIDNWNQASEIQLCTAVFAGDVRLIDNIKIK